MNQTEFELCENRTALRRFAIPDYRLGIFFFDPVAELAHHT